MIFPAPPSEIQTERLNLHPASPAFSGMCAAYYQKNRSFFERFDPGREAAFFTERGQRKLLRQEVRRSKSGEEARYYIFLRDNPNEIVGMIALNNIIRGCFQSCFVGYKLDEAHQNQGYMTEALLAVSREAFGSMRLHRLEGNILPENGSSRRVLEKCGFYEEGRSQKYLKINGVWRDHLHFVKLNEEE